MLPNEVFALACRAYYEKRGLIVDETNGEFAHCPYPRGMGDTGYYLLWEHHQQQGLLQSRDVGRCCFWLGNAKKWLTHCDPWPDDYFDLWDIFEEFSQPKNLSYLHSAEVEERATLGRLRYWQSPASEERRNRMKRQRPHNTRRVEVVFPNGRIGTYASGRLAAAALGVNPASITLWAKGKSNSLLGVKVRYI